VSGAADNKRGAATHRTKSAARRVLAINNVETLTAMQIA